LRFYVDALDGAPKPAPVLASPLDADRTAAREESTLTCEIYGEHSTLAERLCKWACVRCESCEWLDEIEEAFRHMTRIEWERRR
jgi:hypothetical protein